MIGTISYCGLDCGACPIYLATKENNKSQKEKMIYDIIKMCKELYGVDYRFEDINDCDGCKSSSGRLFSACSSCKIRKCVTGKEIEYCSFCREYTCDNLTELFKAEPVAKTSLDEIRSTL